MTLLLVGDGPEKETLHERARELGLDNVRFLEAVPKSRVQDLLARVDVGVAHYTRTPVYRYGVSFNKLFDYMAACLPILFAVDTYADPVAAAGAGLTVPPDDPAALGEAFVSLASASPDERRRMGAAGRAYVEEHHDMARLGATFGDLVLRPPAGPASGST
jgi:glycosyltransferase involved in cell wall biosynthesis